MDERTDGFRVASTTAGGAEVVPQRLHDRIAFEIRFQEPILKSVDTEYQLPSLNPVVVNGYLVYGHGEASKSGNGYEAWYWFATLGQPLTRVRGAARFGSANYNTPDLARSMGVLFGVAIARELSSS
jgi:hypothetical protein